MIRPMKTADLPEVFAVRTSTIENVISLEKLQEYGITEESLTRSMSSDVKGWVFEDAGKIVGFVMGDQSNGEVQVIAVLPGCEKAGVGAALLKQAQDWLFSTGHDQIWLKTTPDPSLRAYGFYKHLGWQATGEIEDEDEIFILLKNSC